MMNNSSRIEDLLTEIRDLQMETRDLLRAQGGFIKSRTDMAMGNVPVSRASSLVFVIIGLIFVLGLLFFFFIK